MQVQVCPEHNFLIPRPIFTTFDSKPYPLQTDFENVPDSGSGMSRAQFPYSQTTKFDINPIMTGKNQIETYAVGR